MLSAQVAEELKTVKYATPPMEERRKKPKNQGVYFLSHSYCSPPISDLSVTENTFPIAKVYFDLKQLHVLEMATMLPSFFKGPSLHLRSYEQFLKLMS